MDRRIFITAVLAAGSAATFARFGGATAASEGSFEITRTEAEWRAMLSDAQYQVMREEATERAGSSPLDKNYADGTYLCRGCDLPIYASETKFDSGTGWPSFWQAKEGAIGTKEDRSFFGVRTECHCGRCGSHLGHIFDDGPAPTGKRHCLNGVSLKFVAA
ncbi:peptide-methionine (R)-S-oxide reductase MsrB [Roseovarius sp. Pro17]|uniref:peptide-methionine (R)-S-oxide reductase MsrB n=1 Tax=Roseovarius sp. Pro17 TaxID=3108175 RepID=UPI002D78C16B|nr:peptide-methionine (R)-S-oxide reductase MsrB [Roseovarius sp. Pro17]